MEHVSPHTVARPAWRATRPALTERTRPCQIAAASPPVPAGKITRVAVTYTVSADQGLRHTFHGLARMQRHIRPERLAELMEDLTVICEELLAERAQPSCTALPAPAVRQPFERTLRAVE
ncbi:MAG: hypothetical protein ACLQDY_30055 [Streptosporangiaceae bacterium]